MHLERFLEAARLFQPDGCRPGDGRERDEQLEERHVVQARHRATEGMDERKVLPKCKFHVLSKRRISACRRGAGIAINKFLWETRALPLFSSHKIGGSAHGGTSLAVRTRMPVAQIAAPLYRVGASAAWMVPRRPGDPIGGLPTCISPIAPALRTSPRARSAHRRRLRSAATSAARRTYGRPRGRPGAAPAVTLARLVSGAAPPGRMRACAMSCGHL